MSFITNWRPNNWNKLLATKTGIIDLNSAEGAVDLVLEDLISKGALVKATNDIGGYLLQGGTDPLKLAGNRSTGWLVFIPDK